MAATLTRAGLALALWGVAASGLSGQEAALEPRGPAAAGMGGLAQVDPETSVVEDRWMGGGAEITLALSQGVPWRVFTLDGPPRLVLEFREVVFGSLDADMLNRSEQITDISFGSVRPGWSRMVAMLAGPMAVREAGLEVDPAGGGAVLSVALSPTDPSRFAARSGVPDDPEWGLPSERLEAPARARDGTLRVMLDPGHGGIDPGAEAGEFNEADLMLTFARELRDVLLRAEGFEVALTRDSDRFVSLEGRVAAAHEIGADVFVSLHADALDAGLARGATVYTLDAEASDAASRALAERHDRNDILAGVDLSRSDDRVANVLMEVARLDTGPRSAALAEALVAGIAQATGRMHKRPLRQAGFSVLKSADIPSVLIEVGFLSTPEDLENLRDPVWRAGMAAGIREGLIDWRLDDAARAGLRRQ